MILNENIHKIYRYELFKKYDLLECIMINEDEFDPWAWFGEGYSEKDVERSRKFMQFGMKAHETWVNLVYKVLSYLENTAQEHKAEKLAKFAKKLHSDSYCADKLLVLIYFIVMSLGLSLSTSSKLVDGDYDGTKYEVKQDIEGDNIIKVDSGDSIKVVDKNGKIKELDKSDDNSGTQMASSFNISDEGIDLIKQYETLRLQPYYATPDERKKGMLTVGYGHLIKPTDPAWLRNLTTASTITEKQAKELFKEDIAEFEDYVGIYIRDSLSGEMKEPSTYPQALVDVMVSLCYNSGPGGFIKSKFFDTLKKCRYDKKTGTIDSSDMNVLLRDYKKSNITQNGKKLGGLVDRRKAEYNYVRQHLK